MTVREDEECGVWRERERLLPGGVNSPVRSGRYVNCVLPLISRGHGAYLEDSSGKRYIDCCMSWGAIIHGHAHPKIVKAMCEAAHLGSSYGLSTQAEFAFAAAIQKAVPSMEMLRAVSSGTEATMSAVRLARAYTNKNIVLKFHGNYHGHADQFLVQAGSGVCDLPESSSAGVPSAFVQHTVSLPYNDLLGVERAFSLLAGQIAAVIVEPIVANSGVVLPAPGFLDLLRSITQSEEALLIFDEVVTGFRVGRGGAQELYGIVPDLTCLGKIIGGGCPAAAFGGRREIMSLLAPVGDVYQAGTLSGNLLAMKAGLTALQLVEAPFFYEELDRKARRLCNPLEEYSLKHNLPIRVVRSGSMVTIFFQTLKPITSCEDGQTFARFFQHMLAKGVLIPPSQNESWFLSAAHSDEDIDYITSCALEFLRDI